MSEQSQYYYFSISEAKIRIARTYYLNLIYFCRKYTLFTRFYEFMLQKVLTFANYAVAVLVLKIMLCCSNYVKIYASRIRQCLPGGGEEGSARANFNFRELPWYLSNTYQMWPLLLKFIGEQDSGKILRQGYHMLPLLKFWLFKYFSH